MKAYILLDRSGSMAAHWDETLGAVNGYVEALAKDEDTAKTKVSIAFFDGNEPFHLARKGVKASKWEKLTEADAAPRGMTPLYDAIGALATLAREDDPERATVVIVTDGAENCSREVTNAAAKGHLDAMRGKGFDVVFLGADFDNFAQGASLGNATGQTMTLASGNYDAGMARMAKRSKAYAASGIVAEFSEDDRAAAAGAKED